MKKLVVITMAATLAVALLACGSKNEEVKKPAGADETDVQIEELQKEMEANSIAQERDEADISVDALEEGANISADAMVEGADSDEEYPQIVYIDGELYYGTGEECQMVPKKAPDGTIETFCPAEIMPDAPQSANFGQEYEKLEYMFLDDGELIIHIGEQWMLFEAEK